MSMAPATTGAGRRGPTRRLRRGSRGDSWQVIYMDLMTIIMVFFVILWSINLRKEAGTSTSIGDETVTMINLPGDVLFAPGATELTKNGKKMLGQLFRDKKVMRFEDTGLTKRMLVISGHTDPDGDKKENLQLGYRRAYSAFEAIAEHSDEVQDHVVICTHADNTPAKAVPRFEGEMTPAERQAVRAAKAQNRRITIEDKLVSRVRDK